MPKEPRKSKKAEMPSPEVCAGVLGAVATLWLIQAMRAGWRPSGERVPKTNAKRPRRK
jgi:hypothetical protein